MIWIQKAKKAGDERVHTRFAWFPVSCWQGKCLVTKWLQTVTTKQRYIDLPKLNYWEDVEFIS
jgi:hypothetical protein